MFESVKLLKHIINQILLVDIYTCFTEFLDLLSPNCDVKLSWPDKLLYVSQIIFIDTILSYYSGKIHPYLYMK